MELIDDMEFNILEAIEKIDRLASSEEEQFEEEEEEEEGGQEEEDDEEEEEEEEEEIRQVFPSHDELSERFRKSLYYGQKLPTNDRPSLAMTELVVDQFTSIGLDALEVRLDRLTVAKASDISRNACASPTSLLLALLYLDRLRGKNPEYLHSVSSTDIFLVSLLVASKFLNDDGEEDEVFNDEWAFSGGMEKSDLNKLELEFLTAIDWKIFVEPREFEETAHRLESAIAMKQVASRGWASYTDLTILSQNLQLLKLWSTLYEYALKVTVVCISAYTASLMTLVGTCYVLSESPVGPEAFHQSISTLYNGGRTSSNVTVVVAPDPKQMLTAFDNESIDDVHDGEIILEDDLNVNYSSMYFFPSEKSSSSESSTTSFWDDVAEYWYLKLKKGLLDRTCPLQSHYQYQLLPSYGFLMLQSAGGGGGGGGDGGGIALAVGAGGR